MNHEEETYLLQAIDNPGPGAGNRQNKYIGPIVRFALETALRQSEILSLEWPHVDLKEKTARKQLVQAIETAIPAAKIAQAAGQGKIIMTFSAAC